MNRLTAAMLLAASLTITSGGVASAMVPPANPSGTVVHHVIIHAVKAVPAPKPKGMTTMLVAGAPTRCYFAWLIAEAQNVVGVVLFQYKEDVSWCAVGTKIVSASRTTTPITPKPWLWAYNSETLFDASYATGKTSATFAARGLFSQVVPTIFGWFVVGQSHPMVSITAHANGTAEWAVSW